jgi:single-strand DNA-binding protein
MDRYSTEVQCTEFTFLTPKETNTNDGSGQQVQTSSITKQPQGPQQSQVEEEDDLPF